MLIYKYPLLEVKTTQKKYMQAIQPIDTDKMY